MRELSEIINEYNNTDIIRIKNYIVVRSLCLPCKPETSGNNISILMPENDELTELINRLCASIYTLVMKYIKNIKMPTIEENIDFMNTIREKNKNITLADMNTKTQDERKLIEEFKKTGLNYDNYNEDVINMNEDVQYDYEREGEQEFEKSDAENEEEI